MSYSDARQLYYDWRRMMMRQDRKGRRGLLKMLVSEPWLSRWRIAPMRASVWDFLVFLPTYQPDGTVGSGFRGVQQSRYFDLICRGYLQQFQSPWTYLDAIDSIFHTMGNDVHLIVADFRSSDQIRQILIGHQAASSAPNYELWLGDDKGSQWAIMNEAIRQKFLPGQYRYFVYTSSDVLFSQRDWINPILETFRLDGDVWVAYPTVTRASADVPYQVAPRADDRLSFKADFANMYMAVFHREIFEYYGGYPDIFQNIYTEAVLPYMLKAYGKKQVIVPASNVSHCEALDTEFKDNRSIYYRDTPRYEALMGAVHAHLKKHGANIELSDLLREKVFRAPNEIAPVSFAIYRGGQRVQP